MPVTIRSAALRDVPAILAIEQQAATASHWTREQYDALIKSGFVLVAEHESAVCGFACAKAVSGEWEIENVVVAAEVRRRGVAKQFMQELVGHARGSGGTAIWLEVRESNLAARCLYERYGFRESGRRRGYYRDPIEDAVLYELRLADGE